ncbi:ankyrin repeat and IBR domain-containing protein 1-like isoform X2 [Denticeps clupeoides]|uniref:ankyrin repeat and IBR domain-containing protein 1-like isoform X2 n=1 Tax=Denticeps clupeoides TaxID=299321 RepID=UPI0010A561B0|nr:ankyrin repeat and IBR domain-containing protein 1-like isoform X2 [Denticeps clupeoides]
MSVTRGQARGLLQGGAPLAQLASEAPSAGATARTSKKRATGRSKPTAQISEQHTLKDVKWIPILIQAFRPGSNVVPEDPEYHRTCPSCSSSLQETQDGRGQCLTCPGGPGFCWLCLCPWQGPADGGVCPNQSCHLVSTLLGCGVVTDPASRVWGCPVFRACPGCRGLIAHGSGCKYVRCRAEACRHSFCFVCLRPSGECRKDAALYWSLSCSRPRAGRQVFAAGPRADEP